MKYTIVIERVECDNNGNAERHFKASICNGDREIWFRFYRKQPTLLSVMEDYIYFNQA